MASRGRISRQTWDAVKIVPTLFLQTWFVMGVIKSVGVYYHILELSLGVTAAGLGLTLGLFSACVFGPGPLVVYVYNHGRYRRHMIIAGARLATAGFLTGSAAPSNAILALTLSISGIGINMLNVSLILTLEDLGGQHFAILYGIGKSGYAIGMALTPLLADYLMSIYGWRGSMMIIGALMSNLIPLSMLARPRLVPEGDALAPSDRKGAGETTDDDTNKIPNMMKGDEDIELLGITSRHETESATGGRRANADNATPNMMIGEEEMELLAITSENETISVNGDQQAINANHSPGREAVVCDQYNPMVDQKETSASSAPCWDRVVDVHANSVFGRDPWLILVMAGCLFFGMVDGGWHAFLIPHAVGQGVSTYRALALTYSAASGSFIGRGLIGFAVAQIGSSHDWLIASLTLLIISLLIDVFLHMYAVMVVTSLFAAVAIGGVNIMLVTLCKERAAHSDFPVLFAALEITFGIGAFIGAAMAGLIADRTDDFNMSFAFLAAMNGLVICLMLPLKCAKNRLV